MFRPHIADWHLPYSWSDFEVDAYIAPELLEDDPDLSVTALMRADAYSAGMLIMDIFGGGHDKENEKLMDTGNNSADSLRIPESIAILVEKLTVKEPAKRKSVSAAAACKTFLLTREKARDLDFRNKHIV